MPKPMLFFTEWIFLPYEILQFISVLFIYRRLCLIRSIQKLLLDLATYTCLSTIARMVSNIMYLLENAHTQFGLRYPLFSQLPLLYLNMVINLGTTVCSCMILIKMVKQKHKETELSFLCKTVLGCFALVFGYMAYLFLLLKSTVNLLDLADVLSLISIISWAVRLIPQISVNWFNDNFAVLHKNFLIFEFSCQLWVLISYWCLRSLDIKWYNVPLNSPLIYVSCLLIVCCFVLLLQTRLYSSKSAFHREVSSSPRDSYA